MREIRLYIFKTTHHELAITEHAMIRYDMVSASIKLDTMLAMAGQMGVRPIVAPYINYTI